MNLNSTTEKQDPLTTIIIERLGERQRKLMRIDEMERSVRHRTLKPLRIISAAAACAAALIVVLPFAQSENSLDGYKVEILDTEYRAATSEITELNTLIINEHYDEAMKRAETILIHSDNKLDLLNTTPPSDEAEEYEELQEKLFNSDVRWRYIMLQIKTGQTDKAEKQLERYMKDNANGENWEEAIALKEILRGKNKNIIEKWVTFYANMLQ